MRVIAGIAKNRKLEAPEGMHTRPITDQIKEALFNMWQFDIEGCAFLDLFAGSGSMGIEALSRGARKVVMVDNSNEAVKVIKKNISSCKLDKLNYEVWKEDVFRSIARMRDAKQKFDIIYVDPPFTVESIFFPVMEALGDGALLNEDGIIAIRTAKEKEMPDNFGCLEKYRQRKYGVSVVHFYGIAKEEDQQETE